MYGIIRGEIVRVKKTLMLYLHKTPIKEPRYNMLTGPNLLLAALAAIAAGAVNALMGGGTLLTFSKWLESYRCEWRSQESLQ